MIVSVPFNGGCLKKNLGCELAPGKILNGFKYQNLNVDNLDIIKTNEILEKAEGDVFIGGDHSVTYGLFKGFAKCKKNPGLIIFDAHPDCVNDFIPPTHEDFLRVLIQEKHLNPKNVLVIGLRNMDPMEKEFLLKNNIRHVLMSELMDNRFFSNFIVDIKKFISGFQDLYLSVDIDVLDPKYAPGTGYPENGGMSLKDLLFILENIVNIKKPARSDIVEVNPRLDKENKTVICAREILRVLNKRQV